MPEQGQEVARALRAIGAAYAERLPQRLREIEDALQQCLDEPENPAHCELLRGRLHSLSGSAGSFGHTELGARATALELLLNGYIDGTAPFGKDFVPIAGSVRQMLHWARTRPAAPTEPVTAQEPQPGAGRLVYLVHDKPQANTDIAIQLRHYGFEAVGVELARMEARIAERMPSALVLDLANPESVLSGSAALERVRASTGCHFPVIVVCPHSSFALRLATVRAGASSYFPRPLDLITLIDRLETQMQDRQVPPYRLLIVDDDEDLADLHAAILRRAGMDVRVLYRARDVLAGLAEYRPELILMDVYMPECDGIELARLIRQDKLYLDVPIVFLSREEDFDKQLGAIAAGADGFLTKPIKPAQLISALSSRARRDRGLRSLIMCDSLTGLFNHSALAEQLERELARARRNMVPLALVMLDVDHFKQVNDTHGHQTGDQVLRALARLLQQRLRRCDIIGRYGGEEFALVLPQTDLESAAAVVEEIRLSFAGLRHQASPDDFSVTFSAGVAVAGPGIDAAALLRNADAAMYRAKRNGRNRVEKA